MLYYNKEECGIGMLEVPDEISYCITFTNCPIHCKGCHSTHNWNNHSNEFNIHILEDILEKYDAKVTCICFLGGEWDVSFKEFLEFVKENSNLKTCLYTGKDDVEEFKDILNLLDFIKVGHYDEEKGGLDCSTTNQIMYEVNNKDLSLKDITNKFRRIK